MIRKTFNEVFADFEAAYSNEQDIVYFKNQRITKGMLIERIMRFKSHLIKLGIKPGSGVGYSLPNSIDVMALFTAIAQLGAYTVPIFYGMPNQTRVNIYKKSKVELVVVSPEIYDGMLAASEGADYKIVTLGATSIDEGNLLNPIDLPDQWPEVKVNEDTPLLFASSSGTTGTPKYVMLTQGNVAAEVRVAGQLNSLIKKPGEEQRIAIAFPLSTSVMVIIYGMLLTGSILAFSDQTSPFEFLDLASKWKCQALSAPPAYFESIWAIRNEYKGDLSNVQGIEAGMDFCAPSLLKRLKDILPNLKYFANGYGLVETCNVYMIGLTDISGDEVGPTNVLTLASEGGNEIEVRDETGRIVDIGEEGEIYVRGNNVIKHYVDGVEQDKSFFDGWFKTGDIARREAEQTITLLGRKKYFIKRGGKSISPIVVQNHINKVEGVSESGVVGVPHPLYGEMIWAFVVKKPGCEVTLRALKKYCKTYLSFYMLPDQVVFIDELPRNGGVRKINFEKLREMAQKELVKLEGGI